MIVRTLVLAASVALATHAAAASHAPPESAASQARPASIPFKQDKETTAELSGRVLAALLACALAGAAGIYLIRRRWMPRQAASTGRRLQLLEVQRIGVKSSLVLLRWDDEELLMLQSDGQAQLVARKGALQAGDVRREEPR